MSAYRHKPIIVDAVRWLRVGDHPMVSARLTSDDDGFRRDTGYGVIQVGEAKVRVKPGSWIITGSGGRVSVMDDQTFHEQFEEVRDEAVET